MLGAVPVFGAEMQRNVIQRVVIGERAIVELNLLADEERLGVLTVVRVRVDLYGYAASGVFDETIYLVCL